MKGREAQGERHGAESRGHRDKRIKAKRGKGENGKKGNGKKGKRENVLQSAKGKMKRHEAWRRKVVISV